MRKFLHNDKKDIDSAIINTARRKNLPPALVEKDFYVCYILNINSFWNLKAGQVFRKAII